MKDKKMFWVWCDMRRRCSKPEHRAYKNYGGRGISVCARWSVFDNFVQDMGARPKGMSLDRRDNDGDYSPENCRWVSRTEQNSNRRSCIYVELNGETITLKEACRRCGLVYRAIHKRVANRGWDIQRALTTPVGIGNSHGTR